MNVVERFVAASDWPTAKKSAVLALGVGVPVLLAQGAIGRMGFSHADGAVDLRWFDVLLACFIAHAVLTGAVSAYVAARGHEGRWTAWLFLLPYLALVSVIIYGFGVANTVTSLPLVIPVMTASIFYNDLRFGIVAGVIAVAIFVGMGVALASGGVTYAPAFLDRRLESVSSPAVLIGTAGVVLPEIIGAFVFAWIVTAARRRERRRLNEAHDRLEVAQRLIRRYVPSAVVSRIESGDAKAVGQPQRLRVTALSSDVAGFTALADQIDPESLSQIINEYMATMSDVVESQGGVVTEFAGDGLMAIFGAPEALEPEDQVRRALSAANAMHARLAELNKTWFRLGIEQPLWVRIGINTGMLSVGTFGSDGRATYTAIGLQMNVAARIQAQCEPGGILLSSASWHLVKDDIDCDPLGEVTVKGVHFPISIYAPRTSVERGLV